MMKMIRINTFSSIATAFVLATATLVGGCFTAPAEQHAIRNGYSFLGERVVHFMGAEVHEGINVGRADGRFTSLMIVVEHAPVEMYNIVVTFGDGEKFDVPTRMTFAPDSTTREIALPGGARVVRRVDFAFGNIPGDGHAKVELWGR